MVVRAVQVSALMRHLVQAQLGSWKEMSAIAPHHAAPFTDAPRLGSGADDQRTGATAANAVVGSAACSC